MATYEVVNDRQPREPVLVLGLEGWIDAGLGAAAALAALLTSRTTETLVRFSSDDLLDHRARRPVMHVVNGLNRGLTWPEVEAKLGADDAGAEMIFLVGPEPDLRWRAFTADVVTLAAGWGVRLVVGLGAFPAPVPHTRPVRLVSTATTAELAERVGYLPVSIDVPAGVHGALEIAFAEAGIPAVGLWARVPHYVATMPYPAASAALIDGLAQLGGLRLASRDLQESAGRTRVRIDELIANSAEHQSLVAQLESQHDEEIAQGGGLGLGLVGGETLPSGDELAAELQRFLRGHGRDAD